LLDHQGTIGQFRDLVMSLQSYVLSSLLLPFFRFSSSSLELRSNLLFVLQRSRPSSRTTSLPTLRSPEPLNAISNDAQPQPQTPVICDESSSQDHRPGTQEARGYSGDGTSRHRSGSFSLFPSITPSSSLTCFRSRPRSSNWS